MIKKISLTIILIIILTNIALCQDINLILRRVYFESIQLETEKNRELLMRIPKILYGLITNIQPIVQVDSREEARSIITSEITQMDEQRGKLSIHLFEDQNLIEASEYIFNTEEMDYEKVRDFLKQTAQKFKPYLDKVEPEIKIISLTIDPEIQQQIEDINFNNAMAKPFEIALSMGTFSKIPSSGSFSQIEPRLLIFPIILDFTWFFDKNNGLNTGLLFDYNDYMSFGRKESGDSGAQSENVLILTKIGYAFRTLGRFSLGFSTSLFMGAVRINALEEITNPDYENGLTIPAGETAWTSLVLWFLGFNANYNLTPSFSIRTNIGIHIQPFMMMPFFNDVFNLNYEISSQARIEIMNLCLAYRI